ncbi:MAG: BatD family protein [Marinicellaceae bacterium]
MIGRNTFIVLFLMMSISAKADVTAQVDRTQIVIGETFNLVISTDENTNDQPDLSVLEKDFRVLGSSQSSSTNIVNNSYSVEKKWQISLMSLGVGEAVIPAIKLGNESTQPIKITTAQNDPNAKASGDIFIEVETDKTSAYVKEQIILTVKLFYSISLSEGSLSEPVASGILVSQLDKGANYRTNRDGKTYEVIERHYALFAEKSGTLVMNPILFNGRDNTSRRSYSMFSTGKPVRAVSQSLSFDIKPIPQSSIGKDWLPANDIQISQDWSDGPYKVGEPITRTITLYVEGLSETQIPDIDLGYIDDIRVYPEQPQTQTENTAQSIKSYKQVKLALIPTYAGAIRIPEYSLEWYNTKTDQIEYAKLPPVTLQVEAGEFAVQQPDVPNLMDDNKPQDSTIITNDTTPEGSNVVTKIVEKESALWKILTAVFAVLWLLTTIFFIRKPAKHNQQQSKPKKIIISKNQILNAIEKQDIKQLDQTLLSWWNQQYPEKQVFNITQIKIWVNPQMQKMITELDNSLYSKHDSVKFDKQLWIKQVKGKGLDANGQRPSGALAEQLPSLY